MGWILVCDVLASVWVVGLGIYLWVWVMLLFGLGNTHITHFFAVLLHYMTIFHICFALLIVLPN